MGVAKGEGAGIWLVLRYFYDFPNNPFEDLPKLGELKSIIEEENNLGIHFPSPIPAILSANFSFRSKSANLPNIILCAMGDPAPCMDSAR